MEQSPQAQVQVQTVLNILRKKLEAKEYELTILQARFEELEARFAQLSMESSQMRQQLSNMEGGSDMGVVIPGEVSQSLTPEQMRVIEVQNATAASQPPPTQAQDTRPETKE